MREFDQDYEGGNSFLLKILFFCAAISRLALSHVSNQPQLSAYVLLVRHVLRESHYGIVSVSTN
jgi:hypothetical protein